MDLTRPFLLWIPFNVPSSKNSKVKTSRGIFHSKTVKNYLRELYMLLSILKERFYIKKLTKGVKI